MADLPARLQEALASRYRIDRELGAGGMAVVFLAEDLRHRRRVALKVLRSELAAEIGPGRFQREIEMVAGLSHPHILPLHDSGEAGGHLYYVMPYAEGESLRDRLAREKQLPVDDALQIAREVADALSYAHSRGVIHRDIKPENILLQSGHAVVTDFGIARAVPAVRGDARTATMKAALTGTMTAAGTFLGTPAYMSPEQATGSPELDGRADLYSLGCVLYEMLAGQPPFTGPTLEILLYQHLTAEAPSLTLIRPAVPGWVASTMQRALAKTPTDRFNSVALFAKELAHRESATTARSGHERSAIAVLPFVNLSADGRHAYFAGGLHDELLTQLAQIAALKVISRTSVMGYQGTSKPLKQIANELGVASVVEGSVQVVGGRLRVSVQLIDAVTDAHVWAQRYERTLDDAFAIQRDVAQQVVAAVGAALTRAEQERLMATPTANAEAYRLYLQGREYWTRPGYFRQDRESAQHVYEQALARDPGFALAHAALSQVHGQMYWWGYDASTARAERQREEAEVALELAPDLPPAHLAIGLSHYWGRREYRRALDEFTIALRGMPGDADLWRSIGAVNRRLGNWNELFVALEKAEALNPRDADLFYDLGGYSHLFVRRYADAVAAFNRALSLAPDLHIARVLRALTYIVWQGKLDELRAFLGGAPGDAELGGLGHVADWRAALLLWEHNADSLIQVPDMAQVDVFVGQDWYLPTVLYAAWGQQLRGDQAAAHGAFASALGRLDVALRELRDDWRVHAARGLALAGLGRWDEAVLAARWLQQSDVYREDAFQGAAVAKDRALILAQAGDAVAALDEIERLLAGPSLLSVHTLRLDPRWDPVREQPRFGALLTKYGSGTPA